MTIFLKFPLIAVLSLAPIVLAAQNDEPKTIRIKKESNLVKVVFDNTELRLMAIDRFGNPKENKIVSYQLWIKGKGDAKPLIGYNNSLTAEMVAALKRQNKATKIFFTEITVEEDDSHLVKLPDVIEVWFPDCSNSAKDKRRR